MRETGKTEKEGVNVTRPCEKYFKLRLKFKKNEN